MASENAAITGSTCPTGATWCRQYGYDHFGNRWITPPTDHILHMATPTSQSAISLATNRLTSGTYDAAGNLTAQPNITTGGGSMAYDANNKVTSFTATGVSVATKYDSAGRRVRKIYNGQTTIWVYDAFGALAAEYTTETQTTPVGTYYRTTDHLGSTRLVTDDLGRVRQRHDFFPFGEYIPASASFGNRNDVTDGGFATYNASLSVRQQFTGQQRDAETGLDYFWARNMAAPLGRFLSMDPGGVGASADKPQTWNAYAYVSNDPLRLIDPDGRCEQTWSSMSFGDGTEVGLGGAQSGADCVYAADVWDTTSNNGNWMRTYFPDGRGEYCEQWGCDPADYCYGNCTGGSGTWSGAPPPEPDVPLNPFADAVIATIPNLIFNFISKDDISTSGTVGSVNFPLMGPGDQFSGNLILLGGTTLTAGILMDTAYDYPVPFVSGSLGIGPYGLGLSAMLPQVGTIVLTPEFVVGAGVSLFGYGVGGSASVELADPIEIPILLLPPPIIISPFMWF